MAIKNNYHSFKSSEGDKKKPPVYTKKLEETDETR